MEEHWRAGIRALIHLPRNAHRACSNEKHETYPFNAVRSQPVGRFNKEQESKHEKEWNVEIISENGECEK